MAQNGNTAAVCYAGLAIALALTWHKHAGPPQKDVSLVDALRCAATRSAAAAMLHCMLPDDGILTYCTSGAEDVQMSFVMYSHVMYTYVNV